MGCGARAAGRKLRAMQCGRLAWQLGGPETQGRCGARVAWHGRWHLNLAVLASLQGEESAGLKSSLGQECVLDGQMNKQHPEARSRQRGAPKANGHAAQLCPRIALSSYFPRLCPKPRAPMPAHAPRSPRPAARAPCLPALPQSTWPRGSGGCTTPLPDGLSPKIASPKGQRWCVGTATPGVCTYIIYPNNFKHCEELGHLRLGSI